MNMDRVANRSLFKSKNNARNKLRNLGGIMSSSESLLKEAVKTIDAPVSRPDMSGIMMANRMAPQPAPPMAPPPMAPPQPQPQPQPQQVAPQPAPQMSAPQPAPSLNPFGADPKRGFALGGLLNDPDTQARLAANTATPEERARTNMLGIDVTQKAGTVVERPKPQMINLKEMTREQADRLATDTLTGKTPFVSPFTESQFGEKTPELTIGMQNLGAMLANPDISTQEKSRLIATYAGGNPKAKDMNKEMQKVAKNTFGKKLSSNQKLDAMNRSITGFAIAAGTSPRASVNFANGMLVGLGEMKKTEQTRVATANAGGAGGTKMSPLEQEADAIRDLAGKIMTANQIPLEEAWAQATAVLKPYYDNLRAGGAPTTSTGAPPPAVDTTLHVAANDAAKKAGETTYTLDGQTFEVQNV